MFPISKKLYTPRAVAVGTSSYVAGTVFSLDTENFVGVNVLYTKGDETSLQVKLEISIDGGATFAQQETETISGGTITATLAERSYSTTGNYAFTVSPVKGDQIKISVKMTGGTPTGTVGIQAISSWV